MKGLKLTLIGIEIVFIGGFFLISKDYTLGGVGEIALFIVGLGISFYGYKIKD